MRILIITGGNSSERKISLLSAREVRKVLKLRGHKVKLFDLRKGFEELKRVVRDFDVIFPVLHGEEGEGGTLQVFLSKLNVSFVGGNGRAFKQAWYKIPFKRWCVHNNILTPSWKGLSIRHSELDPESRNEILKQVQDDISQFGIPCVLKTSNGGSSKEVIIIKNKSDLSSYLVKKILNSGVPIFIEEFLPGVELTVGILGYQPLSVLEIRPPEGEWFDYHQKYSGKTQEIIDAPSLTQKQRSDLQQLALKIHTDLNLGHYSRIDFMFYQDKFYVIDVNTIPGLTTGSLLPKSAQGTGITFSQLIESLVNSALKNYQNPQV